MPNVAKQRLSRLVVALAVTALSMTLWPAVSSQDSIAVAASATRVDVSPEHGE